MPWEPIDVTDDEVRAATQLFAKRTRILIDENIPKEVADFLRGRGHNVTTVEEAGLAGHPDENVLGLAQKEDRLVLTHDDDFLDDRKFPPHRNPGVVVLPGGNGDQDALALALLDYMTVFGPYRETTRNSKIVMQKGRVIKLTSRNFESGAMETNYFRLRIRGP